jgi:geranylgeranylglycerol-phosphate geranylgeranyltransferase
MSFIGELWKLTRFEHAIMLAIAVLIGEIIILGHIPIFTIPIILSLLVPIFSEAGSFALNDYFDVESDRLNKKTDRPLVRGTISPGFALWFSVITLVLSTIFAFFINQAAFVIALVFNILAILYNWKLKDLPMLGNIYIGFTMAIPFIFGNYVVSSSLSTLAIILAMLGFVAGLAREIIKSIQDMEGDLKARESRTLPIIIGKKPSLYIASILYVIFVVLTILPFNYGLKVNLFSAPLIAVADLMILYTVFHLFTSKDESRSFKSARKYSLIALFIGLIGLLAAAL